MFKKKKVSLPHTSNHCFSVLYIYGKNALFIPCSAKPNARQIKDIEKILFGLFREYNKSM